MLAITAFIARDAVSGATVSLEISVPTMRAGFGLKRIDQLSLADRPKKRMAFLAALLAVMFEKIL